MNTDFDFKYRNGTWVKSYCNGKIQYETLSYARFKAMHKRCLVGGAEQRNYPKYIGCTTSEMFKDYQKFVDWSCNQVGYEKSIWQLDKDILIKGNKYYSEDTCVFVPPELNTLFIKADARRGLYPIGVSYHEEENKFVASCSLGNGVVRLGSFNSEYAAFLCYKENKERFIKTQANKWESYIDPRVYNALIKYEIEITD